MSGKKKVDNREKSKNPRGKGRPFEKGRSGNPGGRPKKQVSITAIIRQKIEKNPNWIADRLIKLAREGHMGAIKEILDRVDGRVVQPVKIDIAAAAERVAAAEGIDPQELIMETERILAAARAAEE